MVGTLLGTFEDNRYKSESKKPALKSVDIIGLGTGPELGKKLKYAGDVSSGIVFGRELVNSPANVLTPGSYQTSNLVHNFRLYKYTHTRLQGCQTLEFRYSHES